MLPRAEKVLHEFSRLGQFAALPRTAPALVSAQVLANDDAGIAANPTRTRRRVVSVDGDASDDVQHLQAEGGDSFLGPRRRGRPTHFLSIRLLGPLWVGPGT